MIIIGSFSGQVIKKDTLTWVLSALEVGMGIKEELPGNASVASARRSIRAKWIFFLTV